MLMRAADLDTTAPPPPPSAGDCLEGAKLKDEDRVDHLFIASTHDYLLFFTNQGRVYRQIYGASFETPHLVEPLKQLVFGRRIDMQSWDGIVNRVRLFCTIYNPATGRYRFDYSIFISMVVGGLTLGSIAFVLVRAWLRGRRLRAG